MKICTVDGCDRPVRHLGLCGMHYMRQRRHGDVSANPRREIGGASKHPLYGAYYGMIGRCHNPNHGSYPMYGGRGIVVCDRWRSDFRNFLTDMGERPDGMTLDRIDPNGPYSPENCRWATLIEQRANWSEGGRQHQAEATSAAAVKRWKAYRKEMGRAP